MMSNPSAAQFRKNSFLTTIAHAVWIVEDPTLAYERQWIGEVYCVNNSSGIQGAAYEGSGPLVGAAFNQNSPRNSMRSSAEPWDQTLEHGVKVFNYELMEESEALSEVKEDYEFDDEVMSIVEDIYRKRISSQGQITIDEQSWEFIKSRGEAGIRECRK